MEKEYQKIKAIVKKHRLEFFIAKETATYISLRDIIAHRARILHVSCHGNREEASLIKKLEDEYSLVFEESDKIGV